MKSNKVDEPKQVQGVVWQKRALRLGAWTSCINCDHFDGTKRLCMKYKQEPPLGVIVLGCPGWEIEIPF